MESRSLEDLKRIWPALGGAQQDALRREFQEAASISVDLLDPHMQFDGGDRHDRDRHVHPALRCPFPGQANRSSQTRTRSWKSGATATRG